MSDSESMANKENTVCETQVEDHTMLDLTDKPASGTVDITTPTKKNPTYEKFVRMKMRAKKISQENQDLQYDLEIVYAKIARIRKRKRALLAKVHEADGKSDLQVSDFEGWDDYDAMSEHSDSSSSEDDGNSPTAYIARPIPKRRPPPIKKRPSAKRMRKAVDIPKDENGNLILPIQIGSFQLLSLGKVELREGYYNERYIWPVGYCIKRNYMSMKNKHENTDYCCTIEEDGDSPKFRIVADDNPDEPIEAATATGAWGHVVRQANRVRGRGHLTCSVSGPEYFGYAHPAIADLINEARVE
ncbi:transforming growth factor beta regulator 1 [Umbelopsis sp. WA50703]